MLLGSAVCDGRGRWLRIRRHMALLVRCRSMWIRRYAVRLCLIEGLRGWGVRFSGMPGWCGREAQAQQQHRMAKRHMVAMCARFTAVVEDMTTVQHGCRGAVQQPVPRSRRAGRWLASARVTNLLRRARRARRQAGRSRGFRRAGRGGPGASRTGSVNPCKQIAFPGCGTPVLPERGRRFFEISSQTLHRSPCRRHRLLALWGEHIRCMGDLGTRGGSVLAKESPSPSVMSPLTGSSTSFADELLPDARTSVVVDATASTPEPGLRPVGCVSCALKGRQPTPHA